MRTAAVIRTSAFAILLCAGVQAFSDAPPDPSKLKDTIKVTVGQKVLVTFHAQDDKLQEPKVVQKVDEKQPSVSIALTMEQGIRMLSIENGFPRGLRMRCLAKLAGTKQYVEMGVHPLFPNLSSTEAIGDPVEELVFFDFQLTNDKLPR